MVFYLRWPKVMLGAEKAPYITLESDPDVRGGQLLWILGGGGNASLFFFFVCSFSFPANVNCGGHKPVNEKIQNKNAARMKEEKKRKEAIPRKRVVTVPSPQIEVHPAVRDQNSATRTER